LLVTGALADFAEQLRGRWSHRARMRDRVSVASAAPANHDEMDARVAPRRARVARATGRSTAEHPASSASSPWPRSTGTAWVTPSGHCRPVTAIRSLSSSISTIDWPIRLRELPAGRACLTSATTATWWRETATGEAWGRA